MQPDKIITEWQNRSILVIGDSSLDQEINGDVTRLAPEAPIPIVRIRERKYLPGGAANVAKNIAVLGGTPSLYGCFGDDASSDRVRRELGIKPADFALSDEARSQGLRERVRVFAANQQLIEMTRTPRATSASTSFPDFAEYLASAAPRAAAVVVYDRPGGFITEKLYGEIEQACKLKNIKLLIDANPNHVTWYRGAHLVTFNAREAFVAAKILGFSTESVAEAGPILSSHLRASVVITQGRDGMMIFSPGKDRVHIPGQKVRFADRAGAGDSATAVLALGLGAGVPLEASANLANAAAAVVVSKPGLAYAEPSELVGRFQPEIGGILMESVEVKTRLADEQAGSVEQFVQRIVRAYQEGKTVYALGNGGSASDANHFIGELVGRFILERKGLPAHSLCTNDALITAIANDYGYESVFARQVDTFVQEGDIVVAFSTSGKSPNAVKALEVARQKGATTVGFTGRSGGLFPELCDVCIRVPSDATPRIQEAHIAVVHIVCELLERELEKAKGKGPGSKL